MHPEEANWGQEAWQMSSKWKATRAGPQHPPRSPVSAPSPAGLGSLAAVRVQSGGPNLFQPNRLNLLQQPQLFDNH